MTGYVTARLSVNESPDLAIAVYLGIVLSDGWRGGASVLLTFSADSAMVNAAIKQAAADAVLKQHGVTLDPATEILLVGGAS